MAFTITIDPANPPQHGTATINPNQTINYVPNAGVFNIVDTFKYILTDAFNQSTTGTISVTITSTGAVGNNTGQIIYNHIPLGPPTTGVIFYTPVIYIFGSPAKITTPSGTKTTWNVIVQGPQVLKNTDQLVITHQPQKGILKYDPVTHVLTYTPRASSCGEDKFTYYIQSDISNTPTVVPGQATINYVYKNTVQIIYNHQTGGGPGNPVG
jgi:hypothetical protein